MPDDVHINVDTSAPLTARRMEIITGPVGRRRWTAAAKARIVAESFAPGAMVTVVARRHGLAAQQVHGWRRLARDGGLVMPVDLPAFVPLIAAAPEIPPPAASGPSMEIELAGAIVRMTRFDALADLIDVFTALRRSA